MFTSSNLQHNGVRQEEQLWREHAWCVDEGDVLQQGVGTRSCLKFAHEPVAENGEALCGVQAANQLLRAMSSCLVKLTISIHTGTLADGRFGCTVGPIVVCTSEGTMT